MKNRMSVSKDADYLMPIDVVYKKVKVGPVFRFKKGQDLRDPGISEQMKAVWNGHVDHPDIQIPKQLLEVK